MISATLSKLSEVATLVSGGTPFKGNPDFWDGSIPWLTPKDMNGYDGTTEARVTAAAIGNGTKLVPAGTIFVVVRGMSLHNEIRVIRSLHALTFNQDIKAILPKHIDGDFLYFALTAHKPTLLGLVESAGHGTGVLPTDRLTNLPIMRFAPAEERGIGMFFRAIDDKIDLNRRMNETLEAMAQAIFKDWFCRCGDNFTRSRVSDLIANATMAIGDGYRAKNNEFGEPGLPFIRAGELDKGFDIQKAEVLHERSVLAAREKISRVGDVAFTSKGTIGRFARVSIYTPKFVYSPQVCFWRSIDSTRLRSAILYAWMVSDDLKNQIASVAGQTDMAPYVSLRDQKAMMMPVFGEGQHTVADAIDKLLELQDVNVAESRTLAATGGLLLPKLMSGEIQLRDAEKALDAVA
jgi:type I restriction enzyme S subunit